MNDIGHLLVNVLWQHAPTEENSTREVATVTGISSTHHILCIKALLCEFRDSQSAVLLWTTTCQWRVPNHEKVEARKWDHVDGEFAKIAVKLSRKSEAACCTTHSRCNEVVEIAICWGCERESAETGCHRALRCQARNTGLHFQQAGEQKELHCMVQPQCLKP